MDAHHDRHPGPRATRKRAQTVPVPDVIAMTAATADAEADSVEPVMHQESMNRADSSAHGIRPRQIAGSCQAAGRYGQARTVGAMDGAIEPPRKGLRRVLPGHTVPPPHGESLLLLLLLLLQRLPASGRHYPRVPGATRPHPPIPQSGSWVVCLIRCI